MSRSDATDENALKMLVGQALTALKVGCGVAAAATAEIRNDALRPALQEVGSGGEAKNPVLDGLYEISRLIRQQAPDDTSRDLGIVANGQLAPHYWIAALGTVRAYADRLGLGETGRAMQASLDEAKEGDAAHTAIAERILAA